MIVKYDSLNRTEPPEMFLCSPSSTYSDGRLTGVIGGIIGTEAEEIIFNFNAQSELNLRINFPVNAVDGDEYDYGSPSLIINGEEGEGIYVEDETVVLESGAEIVVKTIVIDDPNAARIEFTEKAYKSIDNRKLIFVKNIGYFSITHVDETKEERRHYKDITARSIEKELEQKEVPYIEDGTYPFQTTSAKDGLFDKLMQVIPSWTIETVDQEVSSRYRTFEDVGTDINCYSFMINDMQEAYECIFEFDIVNRRISVFDKANYVHTTSIRLSNSDVIDTLKVSEDSEDLYTAIHVTGVNDLGIAPVNPLGGNTIYDFSYYLDWMSPGLRTKISEWAARVEWEMGQHFPNLNYKFYSALYYGTLEEVSTKQLNITAIDTQIDIYRRCRGNIVASQAGEEEVTEHTVDMTELYNEALEALGGEAIVVDIEDQISDLLNSIDELIATAESEKASLTEELETLEEIRDSALQHINEIVSTLSLTNILSESEYEELSKYIYEANYNDEYIAVTDSMDFNERMDQIELLYSRAAEQLRRISRPKQDFSVDVESFVFEKEFSDWTEQLETGCLIDVELEDNEIASLFLSSITINYDDKSMSLKFGSRYDKYDTVSLFEDVLGSVSKSANSINYIKDAIYPIKEGEIDKLREAINNARDLSMANALSAQNQAFVIDGAGITGKKVNENNPSGYDDEQVKMTSNLIVFTDDAWQTCKVAIGNIGDGKYGINADTIIGNLIIGNDLILSGTLRAANDSFYLNMDTGELRMDKLWAEDIEDAKDDMSGVMDQKIEENNTSSKAIIDGLQAQLDNLTSNGIFSKFTIESDGVHIGYKSQDASQPGGEIVIDGSTIWFKIGENSKAYINAAGFNFDYGILTTALTIGHENDGTETDGEWTWMKSQSGHFRLVYKG